MATKSVPVSTFLMFQGQCEPALNLYAEAFPDMKMDELKKYGKDEQCPEGQIQMAKMTLRGHSLMAFDSPPVHKFTFTPAISLYINFETEAELKKVYDLLSMGGQTMMALDNYGFSQKFGWIEDFYGVSWQLNLP